MTPEAGRRGHAVKRPTKGVIVMVTWTDSASGVRPWHSVADARDMSLVRVVSVGHVVKSTRRRLVIAQGVGDNGEVTGVQVAALGFGLLMLGGCSVCGGWVSCTCPDDDDDDYGDSEPLEV